MAEALSMESKEHIIDYYWYPYLELSRRGLLDGVMTGHTLVPSLDPDYPSSLSRKTLDLFRELGFDFQLSTKLPINRVLDRKFKLADKFANPRVKKT
jgi:hypothetical protein